MKIQPVTQKSLAETVAAQIAALILAGDFPPHSQLPSERSLGESLDVSRASLREALKILEEAGLLEARPGVGWFVLPLEGSVLVKAAQLAQSESPGLKPLKISQPGATPAGPRRLPAAKEKPLKIPNLKTDRLGTFDFISWWERDKVAAAKVLVVGAGALGNEVVKNLALMGIGHIYVIDFDTVEAANLSPFGAVPGIGLPTRQGRCSGGPGQGAQPGGQDPISAGRRHDRPGPGDVPADGRGDRLPG